MIASLFADISMIGTIVKLTQQFNIDCSDLYHSKYCQYQSVASGHCQIVVVGLAVEGSEGCWLADEEVDSAAGPMWKGCRRPAGGQRQRRWLAVAADS